MHTTHPEDMPDSARPTMFLCITLLIALLILSLGGPWFALPFLLVGTVAACSRT